MKGGPQTQRCPATNLCRCNALARRLDMAFSLIELLVTVVIILILATMFWGSGSPSRKRQQRLNCQKNLQTIYIPLQIYANEHAGRFPALLSAKTSNQPLDL